MNVGSQKTTHQEIPIPPVQGAWIYIGPEHYTKDATKENVTAQISRQVF